ncbi:MAG: glycosyl hydrolase family 79 C-terminal domain-containing protein [Solirubrobacteraceae bacterium]
MARPASRRQAIPRQAIRVQIGAVADSRPVPPGFVGLSIEYRSAPGYFGTPTDPDRVFLQLVRNLTPGQSPVIRFGGDTTDWTWAPTPGVAKPPGIRYTLNPRWMRSTRAAAQALNARLILGVNFESDSRAIAAAESAALLRGVGQRYVAGLELGNEPEVYGTLGWYQTPAGVPVPGRPASYDFTAYLRDYAHVTDALPRTVPLVGPATGAQQWFSSVGRYLAANPRVRLVTYHRYPLHRCFTPRDSPEFPTISNLLAPAAATGPASSLADVIAPAHARGIPFRVDELNSVSCGGARGVSDTFASALWVLDTLFNMVQVGVQGVNIHTFHQAIYAPFAVTPRHGRWSAQVRPMYYGLLLFAQAAPPGARLLPVAYRAPATLRVWSTRARDGRTRVALINDSRRRAVTVAVHPPGGATASTRATGIRLRAPRADATAGVTIGGRSFGASTGTGTLSGAGRTFTLRPVQESFVVRLPPTTATLLILHRSS